MPTSATGNNSAARGFTLVELMVCIAILGLLSAAVVTTLPWSVGAAQTEARRFLARVTLAAQDSVIDGAPRGVTVDGQGYRFFRYRRGQWTPIEGRAELAPARWEKDVKVSGHAAVEANDVIKPGVVFNPTGLATPFSVDFTDAAGRHTVTGVATGDFALVSHDN